MQKVVNSCEKWWNMVNSGGKWRKVGEKVEKRWEKVQKVVKVQKSGESGKSGE